jgi:hypothetical protein
MAEFYYYAAICTKNILLSLNKNISSYLLKTTIINHFIVNKYPIEAIKIAASMSDANREQRKIKEFTLEDLYTEELYEIESSVPGQRVIVLVDNTYQFGITIHGKITQLVNTIYIRNILVPDWNKLTYPVVCQQIYLYEKPISRRRIMSFQDQNKIKNCLYLECKNHTVLNKVTCKSHEMFNDLVIPYVERCWYFDDINAQCIHTCIAGKFMCTYHSLFEHCFASGSTTPHRACHFIDIEGHRCKNKCIIGYNPSYYCIHHASSTLPQNWMCCVLIGENLRCTKFVDKYYECTFHLDFDYDYEFKQMIADTITF